MGTSLGIYEASQKQLAAKSSDSHWKKSRLLHVTWACFTMVLAMRRRKKVMTRNCRIHHHRCRGGRARGWGHSSPRTCVGPLTRRRKEPKITATS